MNLQLTVVVLILLTGCSAHNPLIIKNTTESTKLTTKRYPAHSDPVFITEETLPSDFNYEIIEQIEIGKVWYGDKNDIEESLAIRAQQIGADAVIDVKTWHQPSGWSWAAPHGSGKAIKFSDKSSINLTEVKGRWKEVKATKITIQSQSIEQSKIDNSENINMDLQSIVDSIKAEQYEQARELSIKILQEENQNIKTLDLLAELIWEQRGESNDILIDALAYLCQVIGKSKNPRYRLIMEVVKNESRMRKLRRYAQKSLRSIPVDATIAQYAPGKGKMITGLYAISGPPTQREMAVAPTSPQENASD
jgi:hypothetical protein